jgi:small conductance mechanosensitive channel
LNADIIYYLAQIKDALIGFAPKLIGVLAILIIGFWVARKLHHFVAAKLERSSLSLEVASFINSFLDISLKLAIVLISAGVLGFDTSALVGILAAVGFAVGLSLQGGLSNFASGIIILLFKPYRVDDWIDIDGKFGKVEAIQIFNSILITPGNKTLIVPNGQITSNVVTNFSQKGMIRLELNVKMPYEESFPRVKEIINKVLAVNEHVINDPKPLIGIEEYDTHFIVVGVKPFVLPDDYWPVTYELNQQIKSAFHAHNVKMAYSEGVELGQIGD